MLIVLCNPHRILFSSHHPATMARCWVVAHVVCPAKSGCPKTCRRSRTHEPRPLGRVIHALSKPSVWDWGVALEFRPHYLLVHLISVLWARTLYFVGPRLWSIRDHVREDCAILERTTWSNNDPAGTSVMSLYGVPKTPWAGRSIANKIQ